MKPVIYWTTIEAKCPCGNMLTIRTKVGLLKRTCWECNKMLVVKLQGSSVSVWHNDSRVECRILAQKRQ